ncbi:MULTISPECIES: hypothetical protein [unclassified Streptomyces]|uniref:hypothetical protein n=1 Tax=unclassified Streptomyces TaxID=2593676 RepID=UPI002254E1C6|nr:hypothetical protein [Streptomyces sp. NBC_01264]MCX4783935.1 hypothetical protein [Streptomyces sp. NBC_01264]
MATEVVTLPPLTARSIRRWFSAAIWGSAAGYPLIVLALSPLVMWVLDLDPRSMRSDEWIAALMPVGALVAYQGWQAVSEVRAGLQRLTDSARALVLVSGGGTCRQLEDRADDFTTALLSAYTAFNTRILPRRAALGFARQVHHEARAEGLSPSILRVVQDLAGTRD